MQEVFVTIGIEVYGEKQFSGAVKGEFDRRYEEVRITGNAQWCAYQKGHLESLGDHKVFGPKL